MVLKIQLCDLKLLLIKPAGHQTPARLETSGGKTSLKPQRPVCVLSGQLDLEASQVVKLM